MSDELFWVEYYANDLKDRSDSIVRYAKIIPNLPEYETKAEAALDRAEASLLRSLQIIRQTKLTFERMKEAA